MMLRDENARLRAQVEELQRQLAAPADAGAGAPSRTVAVALERAFRDHLPASATDWVATYHVLTSLGLAPEGYAPFAQWANSLGLALLPPCSPNLLSKANPIYMKPLARWNSCDTVRRCVISRRLAIARKLHDLLAP